MKLWFAIPFGLAALRWPLVAEWFVFSCIAIAVVFGLVAAMRVFASGMPLSENNEDCSRPQAGSPTEGDAQ